MTTWSAFPFLGDYAYDADRVRMHWSRLHEGDLEPYPKDPAVLRAWALFHSGEFQLATDAGLQAGGAGLTVANKATCIYATYLEPTEKHRLALFQEVAERAQHQARQEPDNPGAHYWQAYALGRYSQGISVAKALAQGLGSRVKDALEKAIALNARHADAHTALGAFHAEVIDKVGPLIGGMTYGARKDVSLQLFQVALKLHPGSAIGLMEYGNALVMLEGDRRLAEATRLFEQAATCRAQDAMERLEVEKAKAELAD